MEKGKIKFSELYENFTGSGNINGKYWIVGLEPGGSKLIDKNKELIKILEEKNIYKAIEYFNDFSDKVNDGAFNNLIKKILLTLNQAEIIRKDSNDFEYYCYCRRGQIFRTNTLILPLNNDSPEIFKSQFEHYSKYFDFGKHFDNRWELFEHYSQLRINTLKKLLSANEPKTIIYLHNGSIKYFIKHFFKKIFDTEFELLPKNKNGLQIKEGINRSAFLYDCEKQHKLIAFPQQFKIDFSEDQVKIVINSLLNQ